MENDPPSPRVRERNRFGLRHFDETKIPEATEALPDRVELRIKGRITPLYHEGLATYVDQLNSVDAPRLFGNLGWHRGAWTAKSVSGLTVGGTMSIWDTVSIEGFELVLQINPTRTLSHLLDRHSFEELAELPAWLFFRSAPSPSAARVTLDGNDNMVTNFVAFAGTFHTALLQRVATYLELYERRLRELLVAELAPAQLGFAFNPARQWVENDFVAIAFDWTSLTVSQCEPCWERHDADALARVHAMADGIMRTARTSEVSVYRAGSGVQRDLACLSASLPLPGGTKLIVYAKAHNRLRIEVRYKRTLPDEIRDSLGGDRSLVAWFDAIRRHAAKRIRWQALYHLLQLPEEPTLDALADLMAAVADVTDKAKWARCGLIRQLLRHGSITATNRDGSAPSSILERLEQRGVVEHVRLITRDPPVGRRYQLTARFSGLVGLGSS